MLDILPTLATDYSNTITPVLLTLTAKNIAHGFISVILVWKPGGCCDKVVEIHPATTITLLLFYKVCHSNKKEAVSKV